VNRRDHRFLGSVASPSSLVAASVLSAVSGFFLASPAAFAYRLRNSL
jgi:hypothetical protein